MRLRVAVLALVVTGLGGGAARADGIFTGFAGVSYGSSQTERLTTYGLSLAGMAGGIFGMELDFAQTAKAKANTLFEPNTRATTLNGNLIIGIPAGPVRPYAVGGIGWMRTELSPDEEQEGADAETVTSDGLGMAIGGGLMAFFSDHVGVRADLRYVRAITASGNFLDFEFDNFAFWRFTGGVALRF